jgi:hypothetical protein
LLGLELGFGLVDELFWCLFDVAWVAEARFENFDFPAEVYDAFFEVCLVFGMDVSRNFEIDVWMAGDG